MYSSAAVLLMKLVVCVLQAGCMSNLLCSSGHARCQKCQVPCGHRELAGGFANVQLDH